MSQLTEWNSVGLIFNLSSTKRWVERTEKLLTNSPDNLKRAQSVVVERLKAELKNFNEEHLDEEHSAAEFIPDGR